MADVAVPYCVIAASPLMQKSQGTMAMVVLGIWNCSNILAWAPMPSLLPALLGVHVPGNGVNAGGIDWIHPGEVTAVLGREPKSKRRNLVSGYLETKPITLLAVEFHGCCLPASLSSNAIPVPHPAIEVWPEVHILPPVFGKVPLGGVVMAEQFFPPKLTQSLYSDQDPLIPMVLLVFAI
jgi:hypothetical protein